MSSPVEEHSLAKAAKLTENLYHTRDTYFPENQDDKISKLREQSDLALKFLDSISPEERKSPMQRATFEYLRGKILDVCPDYNKEAEEHLSKAVKLNPSLADAWLCLGNCIWKKGDLSAAKNCLSLALSKGRDKNILCQLSMLKRKMSQGAENQAELVEESIQHAKEAITVDVKDGYSWYNLGNACLTSFFVSGAWDHSKLQHSVKAYQNAVNRYLENYERALSGFEAAALKDPSLNAAAEVQKIVSLLDKLDYLMRGGHLKAKRMASLASSLAAVNLNPPYNRATTDGMLEGLNRAVAIDGKVLFFVTHDTVAPLYYLLSDSNQNCFVLTVYGMRIDVIKERDQLTLLDPYFRQVDFSWKEKHYQFKSIRVDFPEQVLVNGKAVTPQQVVRSSIHAQHKP
ncbi:uncharacterized protein LOC129322780 isoform X4 [Prosopis cineraria]|uniref:uncharacterized protein LOC129296547 isoform X1 n=1 Tax=Prosopis cineraria TaxID=364024 RepID=UPI00240EEAE9|nr:uncharacterized protein LOC129296547 isoform X1 [Prosopis cineraria]XP_054825134.1 uncharacterized protein LOC129322780 isoform X4 [Prosopis cineraria]